MSARGAAGLQPAAGPLAPAALLEAARSGSQRALGRLVSIVEDGGPAARELVTLFAPFARRCQVIGLTGSPGVGKSTATSALVSAYRSRGARVAVLAVDPSSPFSGGALLGDRVRMQRHALDDAVFIRSLASRGHLGGLSASTPEVIRALEACGFDIVLLETVGVGQAEVEIAAYADTVAVFVAAGLGDSVQAAKAGILEIADVLVVNKADRPGAEEVARDLRQMLLLAEQVPEVPPTPVLLVSAARSEGIEDLVAALDTHAAYLERTGEGAARRARQVAAQVEAIAISMMTAPLRTDEARSGLAAATAEVLSGATDAYGAARGLVAGLRRPGTKD